MAEVECFFDCSSPWSYFGVTSLLRLQQELGLDVAWRPTLVGGVFNAVNPSVYHSREAPAGPRQIYGKKDQDDWARHLGISMHYRPSVFPVNSVKAMRGCLFLEPQGKLVPFALATFEAYWGDDQDISQIPVLTAICRRVGVDPDAFLAGIEQQPIKDKLRTTTQSLIDRGGFGVPTFFVGDDMYFGNDRLPLVREAIMRRRG